MGTSVSSRVHRILHSLTNFQGASSPATDEQLGVLLGKYADPENPGDDIDVFSDGLAWFVEYRRATVRFDEIAEVKLSAEKESESLMLETFDGRAEVLPVAGKHGRFRDALEMLRFLDRVIGDLRKEHSPT